MSKSYLPVTIAQGAALSSAVLPVDRLIVGIVMPAAWTAADLTFQAGFAADALAELYDIAQSGVAVAAYQIVSPAASTFIPVDPRVFYGCAAIKVRSGVVATPVNQAEARSIKLVTVPLT